MRSNSTVIPGTTTSSQTRPGAFGLRGAAVNGDRLPHKSCSNADKTSGGTDAASTAAHRNSIRCRCPLTVAENSNGDSNCRKIQNPRNGASHSPWTHGLRMRASDRLLAQSQTPTRQLPPDCLHPEASRISKFFSSIHARRLCSSAWMLSITPARRFSALARTLMALAFNLATSDLNLWISETHSGGGSGSAGGDFASSSTCTTWPVPLPIRSPTLCATCREHPTLLSSIDKFLGSFHLHGKWGPGRCASPSPRTL